MGADEDARLQAEIELLETMYPDDISYDAKSRELKYMSNMPDGRNFTLRLPSGYLVDELPEVLSATVGRQDARDQFKEPIAVCSVGEEMLDALVDAFNDLDAASHTSEAAKRTSAAGSEPLQAGESNSGTSSATVIVWLHHLLNTNKRKLALAPPPGVSGVTKPGYPGVLMYSGPANLVHEHVAELKAQNWQAFQVRHESDELWRFGHGDGVKEMAGMGPLVAACGEERKAEVMGALRMG